MYVVMGATGHVGASVTRALIGRGEAVTVVTHDKDKRRALGSFPVELVEADANDSDSLRAAFRRGRRAFLLNPPGDTSKDSDTLERKTVAGILAALEDSGLEKVVAESTHGAQPGERMGDLSVLWELEEGLGRQAIPAAINRAAYYFSNWDPLIEGARQSGVLPTMLPADLKLPMVAPEDLGKAAVERLTSDLDDVGIRYIEGPERYSPNDVAEALSRLLGRKVKTKVTPQDQWEPAFRALGFSAEAAASYARMTALTVDADFDVPQPWRGTVTLDAYLRQALSA